MVHWSPIEECFLANTSPIYGICKLINRFARYVNRLLRGKVVELTEIVRASGTFETDQSKLRHGIIVINQQSRLQNRCQLGLLALLNTIMDMFCFPSLFSNGLYEGWPDGQTHCGKHLAQGMWLTASTRFRIFSRYRRSAKALPVPIIPNQRYYLYCWLY